jgi:hypothetical protein
MVESELPCAAAQLALSQERLGRGHVSSVVTVGAPRLCGGTRLSGTPRLCGGGGRGAAAPGQARSLSTAIFHRPGGFRYHLRQ